MTTPAPDDAQRQSMLRDLRRVGDAAREKLDRLVRLAARHLQCDTAWLAVFDESERLQETSAHGPTRQATPPADQEALVQALARGTPAVLPPAGRST